MRTCTINFPKNFRHLAKQRGLALLLVTFALGIAATAYMLHSFNAPEAKIVRDKKTIDALATAKAGLITWSTSNSWLPGIMPYPDRNGDGVYDGGSDCYSAGTAFNYNFLLGQLPITNTRDINCLAALGVGLGEDLRDGTGNRLWYAVSRNLVRNYTAPASDPVINPGIANNPTYPWLIVRDKLGNLVSDRVAAIIIAPGVALNDQNRSAAAPAADNFLDTFTLSAGGGARSNRTYAQADEDFYIGEDINIADNSNTYVQPYYFNDQLIFITIDELIAAVEKRALMEARKALNIYKDGDGINPGNNFFPRPAAVGIGENYGHSGLLQGFLPTQSSAQAELSCSVTYTSANASSASCPLSEMTHIEFTRSSGTFTSTTGTGCTRVNSNRTCRCSSAIPGGATSRCNGTGGRRFTCNSAGSCATTGTLPGTYTFTGVFPLARPNTFSGSICTGCGGNTISCTSTTANNATFAYTFSLDPALAGLPNWFANNTWQDFIYYAVSANCVSGQACNAPDLIVGNKRNVQAVLIASGSPIAVTPFSAKGAVQVQPSCNANDYLDSIINTDIDNPLTPDDEFDVFESTSKARGNSYNDVVVIVDP